MKTIILSLFSIGCFYAAKVPADNAKLQLSVTPGKWMIGMNFAHLLLKVKLLNNTADTVSYVSMSCSWMDFFETDKADVKVLVQPCDKNYPLVVKIPPFQAQELTLELYSKTVTPGQEEINFRIGFKFLPGRFLPGYLDKDLKNNTHARKQIAENQLTIWSEPLGTR